MLTRSVFYVMCQFLYHGLILRNLVKLGLQNVIKLSFFVYPQYHDLSTFRDEMCKRTSLLCIHCMHFLQMKEVCFSYVFRPCYCSCWFLSVESWIQFQDSSCGGYSDTGTGFSLSTSIFTCQSLLQKTYSCHCTQSGRSQESCEKHHLGQSSYELKIRLQYFDYKVGELTT